jgi:ABC-type uncharacterized transport system substrate-binding protein
VRKWILFWITSTIFLINAPSADAQSPGKAFRIGALHLGTKNVAAPFIESFERGLKELGYIVGSNLLVEYRYAEGKAERYSQLAAELAALKPVLIVVWGTDVADAAKRTTATIPIVFALADRPDVLGLVSSLARPGGNLTGLTTLNFELTNKRLELLKEAIPGLSRVVVLSMHHPLVSVTVKEAEATARSLGVRLQTTEIKSPNDLDGAFNRLAKDHPEALLLLPAREAVYGPPAVSRARNHRLPTIGSQALITETGGLISYGPRTSDMSFRTATYVDKILKGAKPADLPVEQPTKFEFIINLKTAKQIGMTIPPNLLARADRVIK